MENKNNWGVIIAIIIVILLGVGAYLYGGTGEGRNLFSGEGKNFLDFGGDQNTAGQNIRPISAEDHIQGDPAAKVVVVEYSDLECPFCKNFHQTMNQVIRDYEGQVAWVFRHFPLENLHSKAKNEAKAAECAAQLGGNNAFWAYIDRLFQDTPSNDGLDPALLPIFATKIGLDEEQFNDCLANNDFDLKITADITDATDNGGQGTPFPIIIGPDGKKTALPGALPYTELKKLLDAELAKVK